MGLFVKFFPYGWLVFKSSLCSNVHLAKNVNVQCECVISKNWRLYCPVHISGILHGVVLYTIRIVPIWLLPATPKLWSH